LGLSRFKPQLEEILANENDPISVQEVATRLGRSAASLRSCFPALCRAISTRYLAHRKNRTLEEEQNVCTKVREIVFDLHAKGEYPAKDKVRELIGKPGCFWRFKVRETWKDALRELGY
jgi:hypothetical protein